jgi:hypothetical protein
MDYTISRETALRTGTLTVVAGTDSSGTNLATSDTGVENVSTGVTFTVTETSDIISVNYTTTNTGIQGTISYSLSRLV